jgi:hypothetical protein
MPALQNIRHENFCRIMLTAAARGLSQARCYQLAGYDVDDNTARMAASRLMTKDSVRARIAELQAPKERKVRVDRDALADQLDRVYEGAAEDRQWSPAGSAAIAKGRLFGLMNEKGEGTAAVGDFASCWSTDEIIEKLVADRGDDVGVVISELREFADQVEAWASRRALPVGLIAKSSDPV